MSGPHSLPILSLNLQAGSVVWGTWPGRVKPLRTFLNTIITGSESTNSLHYQPGQTLAGKPAKRKSHTCAPPPKSNTACLQHPLFLLGAQLPRLPGSSAPRMTQLFSSQCPACAPGSTLTLVTDLPSTLADQQAEPRTVSRWCDPPLSLGKLYIQPYSINSINRAEKAQSPCRHRYLGHLSIPFAI